MLPIVALIVFAVWTCVSVLVLALCTVAGRADRAIESFMGADSIVQQAEPDFVLAFAEPEPVVEVARPQVRSSVR